MKENNIKNQIFKDNKLLVISIIIILIVCFLLRTNAKVNLNNKKIEITAHRGASMYYPENTMSAFVAAKDLKADWIELDIQQTTDKEIVVFHDVNLFGITDVNKEIINMTYDEVSKIDVGKYKGSKFIGEKIPRLEDVIRFAKDNNVKLNIEFKLVNKKIDYEKDVMDLLKKYDYTKNSVIASASLEVLKNIKSIDKDMKTVYIMYYLEGSVPDIEYVDAYSIYEASVNERVVNEIHDKGKEIYVWTLNTKASINKMINLGIDNIITDDVKLAKNILSEIN